METLVPFLEGADRAIASSSNARLHVKAWCAAHSTTMKLLLIEAVEDGTSTDGGPAVMRLLLAQAIWADKFRWIQLTANLLRSAGFRVLHLQL